MAVRQPTRIIPLLLAKFILMRFDGALRFPQSSDWQVGVNDPSLRPLAACAALVILNNTTAFLGGKLLRPDKTTSTSSSPSLTSAEVEYEGLLLGLNQILALSQRQRQVDEVQMIEPWRLLTIQGDCKAVVQQMNGSSRPRKLGLSHHRAASILNRIERAWLEDHETERNDARQMSCSTPQISVQHIGRGNNQLCDGVADTIIRHQQQLNYRNVWDEFAQLAAINEDQRQINESINKRIPKTKLNDSAASLMMDYWRKKAFFDIPLSSRAPFYQCIAAIATISSDYETLIQLGETFDSDMSHLLKEQRKWNHKKKSDPAKELTTTKQTSANGPASTIGIDASASIRASDNTENDTSDLLLKRLSAEAIMYQIIGLQQLGREKEALFRARKRKFELRSCQGVATLTRQSNYSFLRAAEENAPHKSLEDIVRAHQCRSKHRQDQPEWLAMPLDEMDSWSSVIEKWRFEAFKSKQWKQDGTYWMECVSGLSLLSAKTLV